MSVTRNSMIALGLMVSTAMPAFAGEPTTLVYTLDIQAQPLMTALKSLSDETGLDVLFFSDVAENVHSNAITGDYSQTKALDMMLKGTNLEYVKISESGAIGIRVIGGDTLPGKSQPNSNRAAQQRTSSRTDLNSDNQDTADTSFLIEEVIVTAQKRETSLQDTPVTITTFNGRELAKSGITSSMDLQLHTPGLVMSSNGGWGLPYLRGIGTDIIGPGVDSGVATYVDGVYQARNAGKIQQLVDAERVEVLKGPQGILYGRNAIGGAINVISKAPADELTGSLGIEAGNYGQVTARGSISGPIVEDKVSGRLTAVYTDNDGYTEDILNDVRYDFTDTISVRGSLAINLTDTLDARINAAYSKTKAAYTYVPINPDTNPLFLVHGASITGDPRKVLNDFPSEQETQDWNINAKLTWNLDAFTLTSNTAFNNNHHRLTCDIDGTEITLISCGSESFDDEPFDEESNFFSQEFVFTSQDTENYEWTALLYYMHEDATLFGRNDLPLFGLITRTFADIEAEAIAAAGQFTYHLSDQLSLIGGIRISHETKSIDNSKTAIDGSVIGAATDDDTWTVATPKAVIQYTPADDIMIYASATRGFKSGGFNAFEIQGSFNQETLWSYEVGVKSTLFDKRLRANFTAFHYDYNDLQINQWQTVPSGILGIVDNAGKASVNGAELELLVKPSANFQLEVGLAYLDAKFDEFISVDPDRPAEGAFDRAGNVLPRAPKFTANIAAEYTMLLGDAGSLTLRGEYYHRSEIFITQFEDDQTRIAPINLINARLSYESDDGRWTAALYGKNLGDKDYAQHILTVQSLFGQVASFAPPRTYGIQLGYNF